MEISEEVTGSSSNNRFITSLCLGTGRFLRCVLVPALLETKDCSAIALIQPRGTSFVDYCSARRGAGASHYSYEVDTVLPSSDGEVLTEEIGPIPYVIRMEDRCELSSLIQHHACSIRLIGVGVTEAGLASSETKAIHDLVWILYQIFQTRLVSSCTNAPPPICILNTDNVPWNGDVIQSLVLQAINAIYTDEEEFRTFCTTQLCFLNTMVDRITSHREGNSQVPLTEPCPAKALVIEDLTNRLPFGNIPTKGVVVRNSRDEFQLDLQLKLVIANATHTACAHALGLSSFLNTTVLSTEGIPPLFLSYLDSLFHTQILPTIPDKGKSRTEAESVYTEWKCRLVHPYFGLSTFFIGQNGVIKSGIRISPTVAKLLQQNKPISAATAFAYASILRYVTPSNESSNRNDGGTIVYRGWLDGTSRPTAIDEEAIASPASSSNSIMYADNMYVNCIEGWYEFKCSCRIIAMLPTKSTTETNYLSNVLSNFGDIGQSPVMYCETIRQFLIHPQGGNLVSSSTAFEDLVLAIATLYARMVAGDTCVDILQEMQEKKGIYSSDGFATPCAALVDTIACSASKMPLHYRKCPIPDESMLMKLPLLKNSSQSEKLLESVVYAEVANVLVVDVHTHLFPPSHGFTLCLFGIDELLTYHYLVSEYFMTAPPEITPDKFYSLEKKEQANLIWKALFVQRTPLSEAARGVITTLERLGWWNDSKNHNKATFTGDLDAIRALEQKFVRERGAEEYCEMIFCLAGVRYAVMTNIPFEPEEARHWRPVRKQFSERFRSALRVDDFLKGDNEALERNLKLAGYEGSLEGARQYLRDWADVYHPEYMMASTPHNFHLTENCCQPEEASIVNESSDFFSEALMKVCEERDLPVALKIGAHRGINPELKAAGDGMVAFADGSLLARLCSRFPKVRFLATFLSRNNQHEACVLANKFRNLHIYGCWWYCNIPSIIQDTTQMRLEMLGTAFTAQHSDARVLDQLVYKWSHSRAVIASSLSEQYAKLVYSGWTSLTRSDVRRDVKSLFGGSYEGFMAKSL